MSRCADRPVFAQSIRGVRLLGVVVCVLRLLGCLPVLAAMPAAPGEQGVWPLASATSAPTLSLRSQPATVAPGDQLTWIATIRGFDADLLGDHFVLVLPAGVTFVEAAGPGGPCDVIGTTVSCTVGSPDPTVSDLDIATILVTIDPDYHISIGASPIHVRGELRTGTVVVAQADAVTQLQPRADLDAGLGSVPGSQVQAGVPLTFTIAVRNRGPSTARNVVLSASFVSGKAFIVEHVGEGNYDCDPPPPPLPVTSGNQRVICTRNGNMDPGSQDEIRLRVRANEASAIQGTVDVSSPDDPITFNNTARDGISISAVADLAIIKQTVPLHLAAIRAGDCITYTIAVTNAGPSTAENVVIRDTLPDAIRANIRFSTPRGVCSLGVVGPAVCNLGTMVPSATETITMTARLSPEMADPLLPVVLRNTASVSSSTVDPDNSDNQTHVETSVFAEADLTVAMHSVPDTVRAGETFQYDISITNRGPSMAEGIVLEDPMPSATFVPINVRSMIDPFSRFGCTLGGGDNTVRCHIPQLPPAVTITGTLEVRVASSTPSGEVFNVARVTSQTPDPIPGNNTTPPVRTTVVAEADLDLGGTMVDVPDGAVAGRRLTYVTSVQNRGPSDASSVIITHTFSFSPTLSGVVTYGGATELCQQPGPDEIVCELQGTLSTSALGGERHSFNLFVSIDPGFRGIITDTATASSPVFDPDPSNNQFEQDTRVLSQADLKVAAQLWRSRISDVSFDAGYDLDRDGVITVLDLMQIAALNCISPCRGGRMD